MRLRIRDIRYDRFSQPSRSNQRWWLEVYEMSKLPTVVKNGDTFQEKAGRLSTTTEFNPASEMTV